MYELLVKEPWLMVIVVGGIIAIACTAIVFITDYLRKTHQAEIDASLKHAMLEQGMSAADIKTVLEATGDPEHIWAHRNDGVRLGMGKFKLQVGSLSPRSADTSESQSAAR